MASLSNSYEENIYRFPEVFVEGERTHKCIVETIDNEYFTINCVNINSYNYRRFFGLIPYEDILNYIDLVEACAKRGFIVVEKHEESYSSGVLIEGQTKLCILEIKGVEPYILVSEGEDISEGSRVAYVATGKGEVRSYKSPCSGLLILVINITWEKPSKYILVVVDKNACRRITIRESKGSSL